MRVAEGVPEWRPTSRGVCGLAGYSRLRWLRDVVAVRAAGAGAVHLHVKDAGGVDTLGAERAHHCVAGRACWLRRSRWG